MIEIKDYISEDKDMLDANEFSVTEDIAEVMEDESVVKYTLVNDSVVKAIICFRNYYDKCYWVFLLASKDLNKEEGVKIKEFFWFKVDELEAERVHTDSVSCDKLDRWHQYIGFRKEGTRHKLIYGKDYDMWAIVKGMDY